MSRIQDLPTTGTVYYENYEVIGAVVYAIISWGGVLCVGIVLVSIFRSARLYKLTVGEIIIVHLCFIDFFNALLYAAVGSISLAAGGYSLGPNFCAIDGVFVLLFEALSLLSIFFMTFERYAAITKNIHVTEFQAYLGIAAMWIVMGLFCSLTVAYSYNYSIELQSSKLVCAITFYDRQPLSIVLYTVCLSTISLSLSFIVYAYYVILSLYLKSRTEESNESGQLSPNQKKVLIKTVAIVFCFVSCWSPYLTKIGYEIITGSSVNSTWDAIVSILANCNHMFNGVILISTDAKVKRNVYELIGTSVKSISLPGSPAMKMSPVNSGKNEKTAPILTQTELMTVPDRASSH